VTSSQIGLLASAGAYMAVMLAIGFWTSRKIKNTRDYIIAGKHLGWWLSIGTLFATWFGAETCMGSSRTAFEKGILGVIADPFGAGLCLILSGIFFAKFFHKMNIQTVVDFFEARYGGGVARILSVLYLPVYLGWIGAQLLAFGIILNSLTGLDTNVGVLVSTVVVLIYTYSGGMWAVSVTDLVQMIILVVGLLILFPVLVTDLGGFHTVRESIPAEFFHFYPRNASTLDWLNYAQAWMIVGLGSLPAQDLFQRIMAPRTWRMARWSSITAGILYMVIGLLPVLLGIMGRISFPELREGESILIDLALKYLPLPLIALMVGALLSAIMSSVDSALLAPAGIIGHNIVPYFKLDINESMQLQWCKRSIPIVGILSLVMALYFQNVYTLCTQSWGILLVGVVAPMVAGVYWKKANTSGAVAGAVAGTLSWILFEIFLPEGYPCQLFGLFISASVLVFVSLLTQKEVARA
jgi:SSS family solute:Na+ symporter